MGVRSFLVHVAPGSRDAVTRSLEDDTAGCLAFPSTNRDVVIVVSDLDDREAERMFDERRAALPGVLHVALVAGYAK